MPHPKPQPNAASTRERRWPRHLPAALVAALCVFFLLGELAPPRGELALPLDDSWIHLQFARQMAAGDGLSYNPGRWVTGSTAPLWTALLALGFVLPAGAVAWAKLLGVGFLLSTVYASGRLARALGLGPGTALAAAALVATSYWLLWSALSGMEVTLFATLSLWGLVFHLEERRRPGAPPASLALLALAALARPEGYLLLLLATGDRLLRWHRAGRHDADAGEVLGLARPRTEDLRSTTEGLALALVVLLPSLLFYRVAGGSFLPTTFAVKAGSASSLLPDGRYLRVVADVFFRSQPILLLAATAGAARLVASLGTTRDRGLLPAAWLFGLPLAYAFLTPAGGVPAVGNFGRYYFPLLPVLVVIGLYALEGVASRLPSLTLGGRRLPLAPLLLALVFVPQAWGLVDGRAHYLRTVRNVQQSDVAAARWLAPRLPAEALLAVQDVGALKFFLPNEVLDLAGIVTPEILPYLRGEKAVEKRYWEERLLVFLAEHRPDYLVVFPSSYPMLTGRVPGFEAIQTFTIEENVTMAGDRLVVYATPWTRYPLTVETPVSSSGDHRSVCSAGPCTAGIPRPGSPAEGLRAGAGAFRPSPTGKRTLYASGAP